MDRFLRILGVVALLVLIPTLAYADFTVMGRGSEAGRGAFTTIDGRGDFIMVGRGLEGRGSPVACWNYSEQKDWSCGECGKTNEYWKDRCWSCNTKRWVANPHDDL